MFAELAFQQGRATCRVELLADLAAVGVARAAFGDQARAGLVHERLDLLGAQSHDGADLRLAEAVELGQDHRRPLTLRQLTHAGEGVAELLAQLELTEEVARGRRVVAARGLATELDGRAAAAQDAQRLVARDREQPRAQHHRALVGQQCTVGGGEGDLERFFGVGPRAEHVEAERQQFALVALVQSFERGRVVSPDRGDQLLVCGERVPSGRAR